MGLWIVHADTWSLKNSIEECYEVAVIADSERGAKSKVARAMNKWPDHTGAATKEARQVDVYNTGVVLFAKADGSY